MNQKGFSSLIILLGLVLIISIASGAYYLGRTQITKSQLQNPVVISQTPKPIFTPQPTNIRIESSSYPETPEGVVRNFYYLYTKRSIETDLETFLLNQQPKKLSTTETDQYLTTQLQNRVYSTNGAGYGSNPITCAFGVTSNLKLDKQIVITNDKATVTLHEIYKEFRDRPPIADLPIQITLMLIDGKWKIDDINCGLAQQVNINTSP